MDDLDRLIAENMKDPEFRKEWEALEPEREMTRQLVAARKAQGMTQAQLSEASGVSQADISRIENGTRNPSIALLGRIAAALDSTLHIEFIPNKHTTQ